MSQQNIEGSKSIFQNNPTESCSNLWNDFQCLEHQTVREVHECHSFPTHQLDIFVSNNGAELTQVPHHPIENLSDAFPLVAAHFLDTRQLHLQSHEVRLRA